MSATAVRPEPSSKRTLEVIIIGAGFGGIAAAVELRRHAGEHGFLPVPDRAALTSA